MNCKCGKKAVFEKYCSKHFIENFESIIKRTVFRYNMVSKNDRIAIGVSGGKDSLTIAYLLSKWFPGQVFAITIDEGISGYRKKTIRILEKILKNGELSCTFFHLRKSLVIRLMKLLKK